LEWDWSDGEYQADSMAIEEGVRYMQVAMVNDYSKRAIEQFLTTSNVYTGATWTYDDFVKAGNLLNKEGLTDFFILISPTIEAAMKMNLKDQLKYKETFVRDSYIGHVNNLPVIVSKLIPENTAIIAHKQAVKAIIKAGTQVERKREQNLAQNKMWIRKWDVVALVREDLCCMMLGNGGEKPMVTPVVKNVGAEAAVEADGTIRIVGEKVVAGVPADYASLFTLPLENGCVVELDGIIPAGGADIKITSLAYKPYYEAGDPTIKKVGQTYQKSKHYDGTDSDLAVLLLAGKRTNVEVGNFVYRIAGDFSILHYE